MGWKGTNTVIIDKVNPAINRASGFDPSKINGTNWYAKAPSLVYEVVDENLLSITYTLDDDKEVKIGISSDGKVHIPSSIHSEYAGHKIIITAVDKSLRESRNPAFSFKWDSTPIWSGNCMMGNWEKGFVIKPDMFTTAQEGDKIELVLTTDRSNNDITYWLMKTIYDGTDKTLEGNENELNNWGCITLGKSATRYRIMLTHDDVEQLRVHGLFVNGYYCNVTQVNLLRRDYSSAGSQEEY